MQANYVSELMIYSNQTGQTGSLSSAPSPDSSYVRPARRGKHKVFIGMAPGVGKTYKMLEEGYALKQQGIDVVIGLLETHGRKETALKAMELETIPLQEIPRGSLKLTEMNPEAIIARQPQLVLIDELAHTNVPGSVREKRHQDVKAVLATGIDVFSTMNIQHLESLNDIVARITGVVVRERVPDRVLDDADEVVVVDVTPETLEERLLDGKIYAPEKIQQSLGNFFQRLNLLALRELALREVADCLEEDALAITPPTGKTCNIHERVMVCLSTYPNALHLLRRGARIADQMNAKLHALYVADPERFLTKEQSLLLETCERLCREFGGEFLRVTSSSIPETIARVAQEKHITQIVMGESQRSRWKLLLQGSFTQQLTRLLKDQEIELHVIAADRTSAEKPREG